MLLIKRKAFLVFATINVIIILGWMITSADSLLTITLLIWTNMLFFALSMLIGYGFNDDR